MSRYPSHTVTLPVLIDAETTEKATGEVTCFPSATRTRFVKVRSITAAEIKRRIREVFPSKKDLPTNEMFLYHGAGLLSQAYDSHDEWGLQDALRMVNPWIPNFGKEVINPDANVREGARWDFSSLMCNTLQSARLVAWFPYKSDRLLSPAVYCPNLKTAAFVTLLMGHIRVCPMCHAPFLPKDSKHDYCVPAHGGAYRTARSRRRKKHKML